MINSNWNGWISDSNMRDGKVLKDDMEDDRISDSSMEDRISDSNVEDNYWTSEDDWTSDFSIDDSSNSGKKVYCILNVNKF